MTHDRQITITSGNSRKSTNWTPQTLRLSELYDRLRTPARGVETLDAYLAMRKIEQDNLKDVGGFVGGTLAGPRRKASAVTGRDILTIDLDSIPAGGTDDVLAKLDALGAGYCVYSTRKHSPAAPRLRVVMPLDRTITADEYEPIMRKVVETGELLPWCDPSTFEASRLMYWPSCSADSIYIYKVADLPMLSADGVLAMYTDWRDVQSWPQVPGAVPIARLAAKQEDPETKRGVVGAFCRTYDIASAIATFIANAYEPVDTADNRYTFTGGSTAGGAVLYDGGKYLFSHHATDPCGGKLVNSFDLVRLHRFADLDDDAAANTPPIKLPSYVAMCEMATADEAVADILRRERYDAATAAFGPPPVSPATKTPTEAPTPAWTSKLEVSSQGGIAKTARNLQVILEHDPRLAGIIRLNLFSGRIDVVGQLPWRRPGDPPLWDDSDSSQLRLYLEPLLGKVSKQDRREAVEAAASNQAYNPLQDYLDSLQWDNTPRLDSLFVDYLGAADTAYTRAVTRKSFVAAVARVYRPGIKYDTMLVLVGAQGRHKSSLLAKMGGTYFSDSLRSFETKEAMENIQGTWINEIAELNALNRSDINAAKAFLSKQEDYYRKSYGEFVAKRPRRCVFFGTTNSTECLSDITGGRRFWPVDIDVIERTKNVFTDLDGERDQLWAEAVHYYRAGENLHLKADVEAAAAEAQEAHRERNSWEGMIEEFLTKQIPADWANWDRTQRRAYYGGFAQYTGDTVPRDRVCAIEIWCELFNGQEGTMQQRTAKDINQILERVPGWKSVGPRKDKIYGCQRYFYLENITTR